MFFDKLNSYLIESAMKKKLNSVRTLSQRLPNIFMGGGISCSKVNAFRGVVLAVTILLAPLCAKAQNDTNFTAQTSVVISDTSATNHEFRKEFYVGFRVSRTVLDPNFGDNAKRLSEIISFLKDVQQDSTVELTEVSFRGSASPEGGPKLNQGLAKNRRNALEKYIRERVEIDDSLITRHEETYIAWDMLAELVEASNMPHKKDVLHILKDVPEFTYDKRGALIDSRKKRLMDYNYGRTWNYMLEHFFPQVRYAGMVSITSRMKPQTTKLVTDTISSVNDTISLITDTGNLIDSLKDTDTVFITDTLYIHDTVFLKYRNPLYMALKTNMLFDLGLVPNIGLEVYAGNNISVGIDWMYGWWNNDRRHYYWRVYGGDAFARYWFGKKAKEKPLTGHHLGVYGQAFIYDIEWGDKGYLGGEPGKTLWENTNYAFGFEYGYSLPIARRFNIDFNLGVGYWGGNYYEYIPLDGHYVWEATKKRHWFGPTKAEVSLIWLIGNSNTNKMKGGVK